MATGTAERQSAPEMLKELLPGKARIGVAIYDQARGRTYRAVTESQMVAYVEDISQTELKRLWRRLEEVIRDEKSWRNGG